MKLKIGDAFIQLYTNKSCIIELVSVKGKAISYKWVVIDGREITEGLEHPILLKTLKTHFKKLTKLEKALR